jgi:hypothetical protein
MNRTVATYALIFASALGLYGQGTRLPRALPGPEIVEPTIRVTGIAGKSVTLAAWDLSKLPQQTIKTTSHGSPATFEGVLLADVLTMVDLPAGEKFHSTAASYYLLAGAKDGYRAVFAWAELDSTFMDKSIYVVTKRDGKPLSDTEGPFELVVPGEKRAARWVRQLTSLTISQAN